ncbi:hypothetical protein J8F10_07275 [Gemmata sp. G18]|uniref:Uncharacterized protein n=1 Tax=Gemmata palustris TaxID=2822762 RepID=A0ABS5BMW8_9BACT|nr:hypothetical protein [Gemmata palustris]MBP3955079.1 hypothetical protein [Gemmata palustris]
MFEHHDAPGDLDLVPHYLADRYVLREQLRVPSPWLTGHLISAGVNEELAAAEADLVSFAWTVPWERERTRRLLGLGFEQGFPGPPLEHAVLLIGRPGAGLLLARNRAIGDVTETERYLRVLRRVTVIKFACRAHLVDRKAARGAGGPRHRRVPRCGPGRPVCRRPGVRLPDLAREELRARSSRPRSADHRAGRTGRQSGTSSHRARADRRVEHRRPTAPTRAVGSYRGSTRSEDLVFLVPMLPAEFK